MGTGGLLVDASSGGARARLVSPWMGASMTRARTRVGLPYAIATGLTALALVAAAERTGWRNLLLTPDQRGRVLMSWARAAEAAETFRDPLWRGVALFRAGEFKTAAEVLSRVGGAEGVY